MFSKMSSKALLTLLFIVLAAFLMGARPGEIGTEHVFLRLKINGLEIEGDVNNPNSPFDGQIAIASYTQAGSSPQVSGLRVYEPVRFRKAVDRSSPLLAKAFAQNESVNEATFSFVRPAPAGEEQFYTMRLTNARISAFRTAYSEDGQLLEEVQIVFGTIEWTNTISGASFQDSILN